MHIRLRVLVCVSDGTADAVFLLDDPEVRALLKMDSTDLIVGDRYLLMIVFLSEC
jgi:hypothetical protein